MSFWKMITISFHTWSRKLSYYSEEILRAEEGCQLDQMLPDGPHFKTDFSNFKQLTLNMFVAVGSNHVETDINCQHSYSMSVIFYLNYCRLPPPASIALYGYKHLVM
ncbi:hypothetical protein AMECASPLE_025395 [Ameca splendens]|uniref:Uncharacterized protein n=1 Tax=Ameca splendens TaxID=208324 RepID=A0ABV0YSV4_9TELE